MIAPHFLTNPGAKITAFNVLFLTDIVNILHYTQYSTDFFFSFLHVRLCVSLSNVQVIS